MIQHALDNLTASITELRRESREDARHMNEKIDDIDAHVASLAERMARVETVVTTPASFFAGSVDVPTDAKSFKVRAREHAPMAAGLTALVTVLVDKIPTLIHWIQSL